MTDKDEIRFAIRYLKQGLKSKRTPPLYEELMKELGFVDKQRLTEAKEIIKQFLNDYPVITKELLDKLEHFVKQTKE